jgi:tricarballylate dehydrogenase
VVIAAGGFEANLAWLAEYWGDAAQNFIVRGTPHNDGSMLRCLLDLGARPVGDPTRFHAVAVDARGPRFDGGIVTRLDTVPVGIVVNRHSERFADEGEDIWPKRYAQWGRLIALQDGQIAYSLLDAKRRHAIMPPVYPPHEAATIEALAESVGLDPARLAATVATFNAHVPSGRESDLEALDGCSTTGLEPPKSNWALSIDEPPFVAFPLRPGITFTYYGVAIDPTGRVQRDGSAFDNVFAAGEVMAGNIMTRGYIAGIGMTVGSVFGRLAGKGAASIA